MKRILYLVLWISLYGLFMSACKHDVDSLKPETTPSTPAPTEMGAVQPVGIPQGVAVTKSIGSTGGSLTSEDGRFTIAIPAGALSKETPISVQPITNTNGTGKGAGYRLLPDGQQFAKPVTLTVTYTDEELERTVEEALGIAYQNAKGIWMAVGGVQLDKTRKTVSIEINHFTDFTFFEYVYLDPEYSVIDPGKAVTIKVYGLATIGTRAASVPKGKEVGLPKPAPVEFIDQWELQGEGSLQGTGKEVVYQSPDQIPNTNPARVIVKLKSPGTEVAQLIARIYVLPEGISIQVAGGDWKHFPKSGANLSGGIKKIDGLLGQESVNISWQGGTGARDALGIFNWTRSTTMFLYHPDPITIYAHLYGTGPDISGGSLKVDNMRNGVLMGSFDVTTAGVYIASAPPIITTSAVRGVFRVRCFDCAK